MQRFMKWAPKVGMKRRGDEIEEEEEEQRSFDQGKRRKRRNDHLKCVCLASGRDGAL